MNLPFPLAVAFRRDELLMSARMSVYLSMHQVARRKERPTEPDFISSLVLDGMNALAIMWRSILEDHGVDVAITGIYCHGTPKVHYDGMKKTSCELGDLIICHFHTDSMGNVSRNALLLQAKMSMYEHLRISANDDQMKLYMTWPEFEYRSPGFTHGSRNVMPSAPRKGAQFMLINKNNELPDEIDGFAMSPCMANPDLIPHADLGQELFNLMQFTTGDPFDSKDESMMRTDWSRVVWDQLTVTAHKGNRVSRWGGENPSDLDGRFFATNRPPDIFETILGSNGAKKYAASARAPPFKEDFSEESPGVSTIVIQTKDYQENPEDRY